MVKKLIKTMLCFLLTLSLVSSFNLTEVQGASYPNWSAGAYNGENPLSAGYRGQCTWYVWGRVKELHGIRLPGLIGQWQNAGTVSSNPTTASIALIVNANGTILHTAYIESVNGNSLEYSEANSTYFGDPNHYYYYTASKSITQYVNDAIRYTTGAKYVKFVQLPVTPPSVPDPTPTPTPPSPNPNVTWEMPWVTLDQINQIVTVNWYAVNNTDYYKVTILDNWANAIAYEKIIYENSYTVKLPNRGGFVAYFDACNSAGCIRSRGKYFYLMDNEPTSVTMGTSVSEINLDIGQTYKLSVNLNPYHSYVGNITWTSSSPSVASVDQNGNVKALKAGGTIIRAKLDNGQEAKVLVRVAAKPIAVKITDSTKVISKGFSYTFRALATPNNASQKVTWRIGNPKIATVDKNGKVTGKSEGLTWLYAKTTNGKEAKALVKIIPQPSSVKLNYSSKVVTLGKQTKFKATVNPTNANQAVTWRSNNTRVATVDKNGLVKAKGVGTAVIYAKTINGKQVKATVKVIPQPKSVKLNTEKRVMRRGTTYKFKATVNPTNANQAVTWRTGNSKIATVDKNGKVTARSAGLTWLYAKTVNGKEIRALIKVTK